MSQIFDKEIASHEEEFVKIIETMEETRQAFISATIACVKLWYEKQARFHVQEQYKWTLDLGLAKLSEMKTRVTQLIMMVPTSAKQILGDDSLWWHRSRHGGWRDQYASEPPEALKRAVNTLAEKLTPILTAYGYIKPPAQAQTQGGAQAQGGAAPGQPEKHPPPKGNRRGSPELDWSADMVSHIEAYIEQLGRALFLDSKVSVAKQLKQKYQAGALWDKA